MFIIIILCFVLSADGIQRYHPLFFNKYGLLIEPTGVVVSYDTTKYASIIIHFPGLSKMTNNMICGKNLSEQLYRSTVKHQIKMLFDQVPSTTHSIMVDYCNHHHSLCLDLESNRPKRQIFMTIAALTGIAGLATSAYDWFKSNELKSHLEDVSKHIEKIDNKIVETDQALYTITKLSNDIIKKSSLSFHNYHNLITQMACRQGSTDSFIFQSLSTHNIEFELMALQKMINGNPDSYLINAELVNNLLESNTELRSCIYKEDMSVFYQVVKSNLIYTDIDKSLFAFLLEIPIIHQTMISPFYKVYNGGWISQGILHKMNLPKSFYLYATEEDRDFHAVSLGEGNCWKRNEIIVCDNSKHMLTEDMICLNSLLRNSTYDTCDIKVSKIMRESSVIKSYSGVLIVGDIEVKLISSAGSEFNYITNNAQVSNYTKFYPYTDFKQIIVGNTIINSNRDKIPVVHRNDDVMVQTNLDLTWMESFLSDKPWSSLKEIKAYKASGWDLYHTTASYSINKWSWLIWGLTAGILIIVTLLYWLQRRSLRDHDDKIKGIDTYLRLSRKSNM
ncbi:MAG: fusion glycoprotein [Hangzhou scotinophara lurida lispivirus 1]|uniref:Fusion glycoprotein n=1 Tax=Hangzhou scotinophara lurida lispivirus 1 TaxID=2905569 RepID=A0A8K1XX67_9MONO|nr:MAG: fusion glycoprotein [Hangzhou scotinophara lurida lispivirus 1]UHK03260.1 MAG: fusion glycoprotein [Hangzhou scotinophara lurida lispivirus 1]